MTTLCEHNLPQVPEWIRFNDPRDGHHAAFAAWLHAPSRCVLVKLFYPLAGAACLAGEWRFNVRHPDGRGRDAWVAWIHAPLNEEAILEAGSVVVKQLTESIDQAR